MIHAYKMNGYNIILDQNSGCVHSVDEVAYDIITRYERMKSRAEENGSEYMDAVKSSLERITNDVVEFYDYIHNNAHVDFKVTNDDDCDINSVVDKVYGYIRSCEGGDA